MQGKLPSVDATLKGFYKRGRYTDRFRIPVAGLAKMDIRKGDHLTITSTLLVGAYGGGSSFNVEKLTFPKQTKVSTTLR